MLPVIKRPCAVVEASVADDVAVRFPNVPLNAVSTLAVSESITEAIMRENDANKPFVVEVAATVVDPATIEPNAALFARVSVDDKKFENNVVVVAFVAVTVFPVIAVAINEPMFAIPENKFDDDAVVANDAVEVTPVAVTF